MLKGEMGVGVTFSAYENLTLTPFTSAKRQNRPLNWFVFFPGQCLALVRPRSVRDRSFRETPSGRPGRLRRRAGLGRIDAEPALARGLARAIVG